MCEEVDIYGEEENYQLSSKDMEPWNKAVLADDIEEIKKLGQEALRLNFDQLVTERVIADYELLSSIDVSTREGLLTLAEAYKKYSAMLELVLQRYSDAEMMLR